jgi:hypothetical protein
VRATTHLVADFVVISASGRGRLEVEIRSAGEIQRSSENFWHRP